MSTPQNAPLKSRITVNAILALSSLYFLFPVWWLIVSSTKSNSSLFTSNGFWFSDFNLFENVARTFTHDGGLFPRWMLNSIAYAGISGVLGTLISAAAGYALAKFEFPGKGVLFAGIVGGLLVPSALLTIPLYFLASALGALNTVAAVIIPSIVSPFGVYLGRIYAESSIAPELIESARIDGAGEIRIFAQIAMRIMSPALVTIFLFTFVASWTNFMLPLVMLTDQSLYPVTLGLYAWQSYKGAASYDIILAGSLIAVIPLALLFLSLQRFWQSGLSLGSVKG